MNWKRGLSRLWLIFSVVWVGSIAYLHLADGVLPPTEQSIEFEAADIEIKLEGGQRYACYQKHCITFVPENPEAGEGPWEKHQAAIPLKFHIAKQNTLATRQHHESRQWLYAAVIVPALLLGAGVTLIWAFRGFKSGGAA